MCSFAISIKWFLYNDKMYNEAKFLSKNIKLCSKILRYVIYESAQTQY